jgi:hypothetical protein
MTDKEKYYCNRCGEVEPAEIHTCTPREPVVYGVLDEYPFSNEPGWPDSVPLYTAPPQREWQGLTDEEIKDILDCGRSNLVNIKKAEQKLKEKNS